ncbi:MAG TPA: hypothetical protein VGE74_32880 [Gemmata sp.]
MAGLGGGSGASGAIRAGRAWVEIFAKDNGVARAFDRLKGRFQSFAGLTLKAGGALGGAGLAALAPLKPALDSITEQSKLADTADAFGLTGEKASRLFGIMASGGSDLRDATEGVVTFNQRIEDALSGTGEEAQKLFADLGRGPESFTGDSADKFYELLDALRQVPDPAKRVQLLLKAVGEDTGKNLIPLLSMSADEVRELGDAFEQNGDDLKASREATRAYTLATAEVGKIWREAVGAIVPTVKDLATEVRAVAKPIGEFVSRNRALIVTGVSVAAGLVAAGAALVAIGGAATVASAVFSGLATVASVLGGAIGALLSPVGLAVAAVAGLVYLFAQTETGAEFFAFLGRGFREVAAVATEAWGGITAALKLGNLHLAWEIALAGLEALWADLEHTLTTTWIGFKATFDEIAHGIRVTWNELTTALAKGLNEVAKKGLDLVSLLGRNGLLGGVGFELATAADAVRSTLPTSIGVDEIGNEELQKINAYAEQLKLDRAGELLKADAKLLKARRGLTELTLGAKEAVAEALAGEQVAAGAAALFAAKAPAAAKSALAAAGAGGTFSTFAAGQQFGAQTTDKKLGKIVDNTGLTFRAVTNLAKSLTFK